MRNNPSGALLLLLLLALLLLHHYIITIILHRQLLGGTNRYQSSIGHHFPSMAKLGTSGPQIRNEPATKDLGPRNPAGSTTNTSFFSSLPVARACWLLLSCASNRERSIQVKRPMTSHLVVDPGQRVNRTGIFGDEPKSLLISLLYYLLRGGALPTMPC